MQKRVVGVDARRERQAADLELTDGLLVNVEREQRDQDQDRNDYELDRLEDNASGRPHSLRDNCKVASSSLVASVRVKNRTITPRAQSWIDDVFDSVLSQHGSGERGIENIIDPGLSTRCDGSIF